MSGFLILLAALLILAGVVWLYNRLIRHRNRVDGAWSDIDVQLQRRHDLVPQLVTAVSAYSSYERAALESLTELRARATRAETMAELGETEQSLGEALERLLAVVESYPDLKANENFLALQQELVETEDYLQFARRYYNGAVRELNTAVESFPGNAVAGVFGIDSREYFQKDADEVAEVPRVKLGRAE